MLVKGHISLEEFNEVVAEYDEEIPPATAVHHCYVRYLPGWCPDEPCIRGYFEHWGDNPRDKRGCIAVTERGKHEETRELS